MLGVNVNVHCIICPIVIGCIRGKFHVPQPRTHVIVQHLVSIVLDIVHSFVLNFLACTSVIILYILFGLSLVSLMVGIVNYNSYKCQISKISYLKPNDQRLILYITIQLQFIVDI